MKTLPSARGALEIICLLSNRTPRGIFPKWTYSGSALPLMPPPWVLLLSPLPEQSWSSASDVTIAGACTPSLPTAPRSLYGPISPREIVSSSCVPPPEDLFLPQENLRQGQGPLASIRDPVLSTICTS